MTDVGLALSIEPGRLAPNRRRATWTAGLGSADSQLRLYMSGPIDFPPVGGELIDDPEPASTLRPVGLGHDAM
jgi:hypothetical protein